MSAMSETSSSSSSGVEITSFKTATMGVRSEKRHFTCRIEKATELLKCEQLIEDQKFHFKMGASIGLPTTWEFDLRNNGYYNSIDANFELLSKPGGVVDVYASYKVVLKNKEGNVHSVFEEDCSNMTDEHEYDEEGGPLESIIEKQSDLTDLVQADGSLLVEIDFELFSKVGFVPVCEDLAGKVKEFEGKSVQQLGKDLRQLMTMRDVHANAVTSIISKDYQEFPVNRGVLAARSVVFKRMFQAEMSESTTGVVRIKDLSGKAINVLLYYLCTGALHQDWNAPEVIEELTSAAHRYELHLLTAFLDDVLEIICTKDNAMRLAVLAKTLGMKKAEMDLVAFVKTHAATLADLMGKSTN